MEPRAGFRLIKGGEKKAIVSHETIYQHVWETDTVIGKNHQGVLVVIVERVSKFMLIKKVNSKHADVVTQATISLLNDFKDKTLTITADNGKEFAGHEIMAKDLDTDVYFAHPYIFWECGFNENTNGLLRQYFIKSSSLENITDEQVQQTMEEPNHRPESPEL